MNKEEIKYSNPGINLFGAYQIIGGIFGIGMVIYVILNHIEPSVTTIAMLVAAFALYIYSILCGLLLLKNVNKGLKYSYINQFLQILSFSFFGYGFYYVSGVFLTIGIDLNKSFNFTLEWGLSSWHLIYNSDQGVRRITVNIVAILLLIYIDKQESNIENTRITDQVSEIGNVE